MKTEQQSWQMKNGGEDSLHNPTGFSRLIGQRNSIGASFLVR